MYRTVIIGKKENHTGERNEMTDRPTGVANILGCLWEEAPPGTCDSSGIVFFPLLLPTVQNFLPVFLDGRQKLKLLQNFIVKTQNKVKVTSRLVLVYSLVEE